MTDQRPDPSADDWIRLGDRVKERLKQIGLGPADVETAGGPKPTKLREITSGRSRVISDRLKEGLERALSWGAGSVDSVLAGGEPIVIRVTHVGADNLRRRIQIEAKPRNDRTTEEVEFLRQVEQRISTRRPDPNIGVDAHGEFRTAEIVFGDWQQARARLLNLTLEYAHARKIPFDAAEKELPHVLEMANDVSSGTGRPWTPPWNPGDAFLPGDEPWKRSWWPHTGQTSPYNLGIHQIGGPDWDISRVHENRKRALKERRVWNDYRKVTLAAQERGLADVLRAAEYWGRDSGVDWGVFNKRFAKLLEENAVTSLDDVKRALADLVPDTAEAAPRSRSDIGWPTGDSPGRELDTERDDDDDAPPSLADAARTAPLDYQPGRAEQGEAGGEEDQDWER